MSGREIYEKSEISDNSRDDCVLFP